MFDVKPPPIHIISRAALFRLMLVIPRPTYPLQFQFSGIEHEPLSVRAISSAERHALLEESDKMTGSVRTSYVAAGVIAQSLITANGKPVFGSIESVLDSISMDEIALLDDAVTNALSIVSPIVGLSEYGAWHTALCDGAKDPSNVWAAHAIGDAYILVDGPHINPRIIDRPEDYWGISRRELIDCHWLAYRAARAVKEQGLK